MTGVAVREDAELSVVPSTSLGQWAQEARQAAAVAVSLAKTPFVPASLRDRNSPEVTAANITAAILTGRELGLEPMAALRSIDVIQGTPALRAMTMRAVALAHGHDLWLAESTNTRAIVRGRRNGSEQIQESIWTLDRAKALGLAGKDNWRKQPAAMLVARATAECARLVAADALLGMPYAVEELNDGGDPNLAPDGASEDRKPRRTAQRRTRQAQVAPAPASAEDPGPEPGFDEPEPASEQVTEAQIKKMQVLYRELDVNDRNERLADIGGFTGRDVTSSTGLTKDEASRLIDDLERRVSGMTPEDADELFGGQS